MPKRNYKVRELYRKKVVSLSDTTFWLFAFLWKLEIKHFNNKIFYSYHRPSLLKITNFFFIIL